MDPTSHTETQKTRLKTSQTTKLHVHICLGQWSRSQSLGVEAETPHPEATHREPHMSKQIDSGAASRMSDQRKLCVALAHAPSYLKQKHMLTHANTFTQSATRTDPESPALALSTVHPQSPTHRPMARTSISKIRTGYLLQVSASIISYCTRFFS